MFASNPCVCQPGLPAAMAGAPWRPDNDGVDKDGAVGVDDVVDVDKVVDVVDVVDVVAGVDCRTAHLAQKGQELTTGSPVLYNLGGGTTDVQAACDVTAHHEFSQIYKSLRARHTRGQARIPLGELGIAKNNDGDVGGGVEEIASEVDGDVGGEVAAK